MITLKEKYHSCPSAPKENLEFLTHCTEPKLKETIKSMNILKKNRSLKLKGLPLAQDDAPEGVWFTATLRNGDLPSISPIGKERLLKPVESLKKDLSSCKPVLYLETITFQERTTDVRLILLKGDDTENSDWCKEKGLYELDIDDNKFLTIDRSDDIWIWKIFENKPEEKKPDTWVVLFIAGDVDVTDCKWDKVDPYCKNCNTKGHFSDKCPSAVCKKCGRLGHWAKDCRSQK